MVFHSFVSFICSASFLSFFLFVFGGCDDGARLCRSNSIVSFIARASSSHILYLELMWNLLTNWHVPQTIWKTFRFWAFMVQSAVLPGFSMVPQRLQMVRFKFGSLLVVARGDNICEVMIEQCKNPKITTYMRRTDFLATARHSWP